MTAVTGNSGGYFKVTAIKLLTKKSVCKIIIVQNLYKVIQREELIIMAMHEWGKHFVGQSFSVTSDYAKEKMHKLASVNVMVVEPGGAKSVREGGRMDCSALYQSLKETRKDASSRPVSWMAARLKSVPYDIPDIYSLGQEENVLANMYQRIDIMKSGLCQTDAEAILLDWKKTGEDINGAINTYRGRLAGKDWW